jgi:CubicO group peptidase (beta-lactamase class C family)
MRPLVIGVMLAQLAGGCDRVEAAAEVPDQVDRFVTETMTRLHIPGVAVAIVRAGKIEKLAAYGVANLEWQIPATKDTRFQIASATKVFTATAVMLLVQDGKLALADPVSKYLADAPPAWRSVTIAHLAAHASGIPDLFDPKIGSVAEAYAVLRDKPLAFAPGARAEYVSGDHLVLSHILERVSGMAFPELLRTRLFEPLQFGCTDFEDASEAGMTRTARVMPRRASVYRWQVDQQRLHWALYPPYTYAMGGVFSCAADLAKWAVAMDRGTLSAQSERRAATPFRLADGTSSGFGVVFAADTQRGHRRYGHSGGPALGDVLRLPDDKITIIVLTNQQRLLPKLAATIASLLLPPGRETAIPDTRPALTQRLRAVADGLATGQLEPASFAPDGRAQAIADLRDWGPVTVGAWSGIDRWSLVEEKTAGARRTRVYRAQHGHVPVRWTFKLDASDLIVDVDPQAD